MGCLKAGAVRSLLAGLVLLLGSVPQAFGQAGSPGEVPLQRIIRGNYERVYFEEDVTRIAVGDSKILSLELLNTREALVLGKEVGRTNVVIWTASQRVQRRSFSVEEDLSVLKEALHDLDPKISLEMAPDRDAIVLRGTVATAAVLDQAVRVASDYLNATGRRRRGSRASLSRYEEALVGYVRALSQALSSQESQGEAGAPSGDEAVPSTGETAVPLTSSRVINLLRVREVPESLDRRLLRVIQPLAGGGVTIRRLQTSDVPDDRSDVFVLEGKVADQVTLVRLLTLAAQMVRGPGRGDNSEDTIQVIAEEGGGIFEGGGQNRQSRSRGNSGGAGGFQGGGNSSGLIPADLETNVARARALSVAGGRLLSFIEVSDLPLVRVQVGFYEIQRSELLRVSTDWAAFLASFDQPALLEAGLAPAFQGAPATVGSFETTDIQNVLSSISGSLGNQFQLVDSGFAVDAAFALLETRGLARRLSAPSLTVLSGEEARLSIGGEVPIQELFASAVDGEDAPGVFTSVRFRSFGISLEMRPRVDEQDRITLELAPVVSQPDQVLTSLLRETTGEDQVTTAFQSRSLLTSSRLLDGQTLMLGGLTSRGDSRDVSQTPILGDIPVLGWLFRGMTDSEDDRELVIIVNPTIVREPIPDLAIWEFPHPLELLESRTRERKRDRDEEEREERRRRRKQP